MKKITYILFVFASLLLGSCNLMKSEDDKISDILIGNTYQEDETLENGSKITDYRSQYFKDGTYKTSATIQIYDDESTENVNITFKVTGTWKVKDKFIYYTYDYDKLKIEPETWDLLMRDKLIEDLKTKNTPDEILSYDPAKIIYKNSDGEKRTIKKSY
jgi:hypothetical protein